MRAYAEAYLSDVVENQGKLFDFVAQSFPDKNTEDFINTYMKSKTRKSIDEAQAYVNTMDVEDLWSYFLKTDHYRLQEGDNLKGFSLKETRQEQFMRQHLSHLPADFLTAIVFHTGQYMGNFPSTGIIKQSRRPLYRETPPENLFHFIARCIS